MLFKKLSLAIGIAISLLLATGILFFQPLKEIAILSYANYLAKNIIIVDGHIDLPYRLAKQQKKTGAFDDVSQLTKEGEFDYVRSQEGGLDAPFMSIYIPVKLQKIPGASKISALDSIAIVEKIIADHPTKFAYANSPSDIINNTKDGKISLPQGMENGSGIEDKLDNLDFFYNKGIRYITLTHAKDNLICDSSYANTATWKGLSPFGKKVIKRMNELGIIIDISHLSDLATKQTLALSRAPVIASHSSLRHFVPTFERNLPDSLLKNLAQNGGVIMINFGSTFVSEVANKSYDTINKQVDAWVLKNPKSSNKERDTYKNNLIKSTLSYATVGHVADHIDYVVDLVGIDYVGFGSDFDGVGDTLPIGLKDVSDFPHLIAELLKRGYSKSDIEKMASGNIFRVWNTVIEIAKTST